MMQLLPGGSIFSPKRPRPAPLPPAAQPVERTDPNVAAAREELRMAELRRRGRAATILSGELEEEPTLGRAQAGGTSTAANQSLG